MTVGAGEYARDLTFTLDGPVRGDAGTTVVALAAGSTLYLVTVERSIDLDFDDPVGAVAVGRYVVVLAEGTVHALSETGVTVWSTDVPGATDVAAASESGLVGVLAGDTVVGLDQETGSELFAVERPDDRPEPEGLFGAAWGLALPAWSYLTAYDGRGEMRYDRNLDGIVETVGTLGDLVVVGLRGDETVALTTAGESAWRRSLGVEWLAPTGVSVLPALTAEDPVLLTADGGTEHLAVGDAPESVYRTHGGAVCCTIADGEVTVYRRLESNPEDVTAEIVTEKLERDGDLTASVHNGGDEPVRTEISVETDSVQFAGDTEQVSLAPGDEERVEWAVENVGGEEATVTVTAGETTVTRETLAVAGSAPGEALSVSGAPVSVEDGTVTVRIAVTNDGTSTFEDGRIDPPGQPLPTVPPGESTTVEQSAGFDPGLGRTLRVQGRLGSERVTAETDVTFPDLDLDMSVRQTDGDRDASAFADVRTENGLDVPVTDSVRVQTPDRQYERAFDLPADSVFTLALPVSSAGTVEATIEGLDVSATGEIGIPRADRTTDAVFESGNEPAVRITREATDALAGYAIRERLVVRNDGAAPARNLRVDVDDAEWTTDQLDPGEELTLERRHVVQEPGRVTLEGGRVTHADGDVPVEAVDVSVRPAEMRAEATVDVGSETHSLALTVENGGDEQIGIETAGADITAGEPIRWESNDLGELRSIPAGERATASWEVPIEQCDVPDRAVRVVFVYRRVSESETTTLQTLAPVDGGAEQPVALSVTSGADIAAGEYGYLEVSVTNPGRRPVEGLTIEANHDALTPMYAPERDRDLDPGESFDHEVSLNPSVAGDTTITLTVEGELHGERFSERHDVTGPVAPAGEWSDDLLADWEVVVGERTVDEETSEDVIATEYVRRGTPR